MHAKEAFYRWQATQTRLSPSTLCHFLRVSAIQDLRPKGEGGGGLVGWKRRVAGVEWRGAKEGRGVVKMEPKGKRLKKLLTG